MGRSVGTAVGEYPTRHLADVDLCALSSLQSEGGTRDIDRATIFFEAEFGEFTLELRLEARIFAGGDAVSVEIDR